MKKLLLVASLVLASASMASVQDANAEVPALFADTSAAVPPAFSQAVLWPSAGLWLVSANANLLAEPRTFAAPAEAGPASPEPKSADSNRGDWQLALGVSLLRFRSSAFYATAVGTDTSVTYFARDWLGVEGKIITAFAPTIYLNEHVKYFSYGAGPKIAWRGRKWEPWAHTIVGGVHIQPQTADNSRNGFGLQAGGGVDYRIRPNLSARVGVDWVGTSMFGQWQNSAQANVDVVLHF